MQLQREREEEQRQKVSIISTVLEKEYFYWRTELCSYIVIANFICITIKKFLKYSIGNNVHRIVLYCTVCVHCYKGKNSCYPIYGLGYQDRLNKERLGTQQCYSRIPLVYSSKQLCGPVKVCGYTPQSTPI